MGENAKRIGQQAIKALPDLKTGGAPVKNVLVRTDVGCSDSQLHDKYTNWDPKKRTFFLNEIEPSSTTYFVRWLKFDCIPMYAKLYVQKAREIFKRQQRFAGRAMKTVTKHVMKSKALAKRKRVN